MLTEARESNAKLETSLESAKLHISHMISRNELTAALIEAKALRKALSSSEDEVIRLRTETVKLRSAVDSTRRREELLLYENEKYLQSLQVIVPNHTQQYFLIQTLNCRTVFRERNTSLHGMCFFQCTD